MAKHDVPESSAAETLATKMLGIIESEPDKDIRQKRLDALTGRAWQQGAYRRFLETVLNSDAFPEDAKLRLITLGRPGPESPKSFVVNQPMLATEMILAIADAPARPVVREQRLYSLGFTPDDAVSSLMRESRDVRDNMIARIRARYQGAARH